MVINAESGGALSALFAPDGNTTQPNEGLGGSIKIAAANPRSRRGLFFVARVRRVAELSRWPGIS